MVPFADFVAHRAPEMSPATSDINGYHHQVECQAVINLNSPMASAQQIKHVSSAYDTEQNFRASETNAGNGCDLQTQQESMAVEDPGHYSGASSPLEESGELDPSALETPQLLRWAYEASKGRLTIAEILEKARWEEGTTQNEV
jgi:hypothetical protein